MRRPILLLAVAASLASCGPAKVSGTISPAGGPAGPAFEMSVVGKGPCPKGLEAPICVTVRIVNHGDTGDGFCQLTGVGAGNVTIYGQDMQLHGMSRGAHLRKVVPWITNIPEKGWYGVCAPSRQL